MRAFPTGGRLAKLASASTVIVAGTGPHHSNTITTPPINRIPPEVLGDIFKTFLNGGDRVQHNTCLSVSGESDLAPLVLIRVCSQWRELIMAMPSLWSSISITVPKSSYIPLTKFWLSRTGECPLSIRLHQSSRPDEMENNATQAILSILLLHSYHWRQVDLFFSSPGIQYPINSLTTLSIPLLEDLSLDLKSTRKDSKVDQIWRKFHSAPRLQRLYWHSPDNELPRYAPWARLTYLNFENDVHVDVLLDSLQACESLELLDVVVDSPLAPSVPIKSLTLERLRHLKIVFLTGVHYLYDNISLPSLTSLHIEHQCGVEQPRKCQSFRSFLERSSCRLKAFEFWDTSLTQEELLLYLEPNAMASVTKLTIASEVNDDVARLLTPGSDSAMAFLPELEDMEFIPSCGGDKLAFLASSRFTNRSCTTLKTLVANGVTFDLCIWSIFDRLFHSCSIR